MGLPESQTILLVEDDPNDVLLIQRAFRNARLANPVSITNDGDEAVNYLSGAGKFANRDEYPMPILVLMDLKLPRRSGLEVLEWIRQQNPLCRLPVIVLTSSSQSSDINRAYDLGANSYLTKPVSFESLLEMVKTLNMYWLVLNRFPDLKIGRASCR